MNATVAMNFSRGVGAVDRALAGDVAVEVQRRVLGLDGGRAPGPSSTHQAKTMAIPMRPATIVDRLPSMPGTV